MDEAYFRPQVAKTCTLCKEQNPEDTRTDFQNVLGCSCPKRILRLTPHFFVVPTIGQIPADGGHLLIVAREHFPSAAHIPVGWFDELEDLMEEVYEVLGETFQISPVFFEHGSMVRESGGSSVDHCHIHAVPADVDLIPILRNRFLGRRITNLRILIDNVGRAMPYLFFQNRKGDRWVFDVPSGSIPSQFLRILVAEQLKMKERWNWKTTPGTEQMLLTIEKLFPWKVAVRQRQYSKGGSG